MNSIKKISEELGRYFEERKEKKGIEKSLKARIKKYEECPATRCFGNPFELDELEAGLSVLNKSLGDYKENLKILGNKVDPLRYVNYFKFCGEKGGYKSDNVSDLFIMVERLKDSRE